MRAPEVFLRSVDSRVLGVFRVGFGLVMAASLIRFLVLGWAKPLYADPQFHFSYPGFEWITPLPLGVINGLLVVAIISALAFAWGRFAKGWLVLFVVIFTYLELIDAATYLNHYYFVSILGLLMLLLPMDASLMWNKGPRRVPRWTILCLRYQVGLVYFFAGVAKLNPDWLFEAMPLRIWLPARAGMPLIGPLLDVSWMPWVMSWGGALFDLSIPFILAVRKWRPWGYLVAIGFHAATYVLFNIGMFPFVMLVAALVFFEADEWDSAGRFFTRRWQYLAGWLTTLGIRSLQSVVSGRPEKSMGGRAGFYAVPSWVGISACAFLFIQSLLPVRHVLYPGDRIWTEEGFRFAWHVMVAEKTGSVTFNVHDPASGKRWTMSPSDDLTLLQEKQMSFQPDLIWQYAQHLELRFQEAGYADVEVRAEAYVSVNGRPSRLLIDPDVDLTAVDRGPPPASWILRYSSAP